MKGFIHKGFTLIELLIVVAIIGILAAVGAAVIPGLLEKTKITAVTANHATMVRFINIGIAQCNTGVFDLKDIKTASGGNTDPPCYDIIGNNKATYTATTFSAHFEGIKLENVYGCPASINPSCPQIFSTSQACIGSHNPSGKGCTTITGVSNTVTVVTCTKDPCGASEKLTDTININ